MQCAIVTSSVTTEGLAFRCRARFLKAVTARDFAEQVEVLFKDSRLQNCIAQQARKLVVTEYGWGAQSSRFECILLDFSQAEE